MYFGRNLDVESSYGEKVLITPRNYLLPYHFLNDYKTKFSIIGMGIVVNTYPMYFDACNEKGLCIAGLNFPKLAHFNNQPVKEKINLTPYELMLWVCSQFENVSELKKVLANVNLVDKQVTPEMPVAPLHWLISDNKETITVEMTRNQGLKVYDNQIGVLTNSPEFDWHVKNLMNYAGMTPYHPKNISWKKQLISSWGSWYRKSRITW